LARPSNRHPSIVLISTIIEFVHKHSRQILFLASFFLLACFPALHAQTSATAGVSLLPGPKPPDAPLDWKLIVGVYDGDITILERNERLFWRASDGKEAPIYPSKKAGYAYAIQGGADFVPVTDSAGHVTELRVILRDSLLPRVDAGSDSAHFYHITPSKPLDVLRAAALAAKPPQEAGVFHKPDLVELITLDPAFHLDIRYAQSNNFLSTPVYTEAQAFLQRPAAEALLRVLRKLHPLGYGTLIHDAYRPWYVTKIFWDATPPQDHIFVADPQKGSRHNRGCAVDLTLYDLASGQPIEMPGLYDEMSPRSFPNFPGGTSLQRWHRDLLRRAMEAEGFTVNEDEWWHFDYKDWKFYPILNVPFEDLRFASLVH
jgi:D-alanyl-D-alanine dipeptidase